MTRAEQEAREIHYLALIEANRIAREQWDKGYKQAEKDVISIIESRLSEFLGDAQPTPILRAELWDLIKKISEKSMKKNKKVLPADMDKECIALCEALNELPHTETEESCCGHLRSPFRIWLRCSSFTYLAIVARAIDRRYSGTQKEWRLVSETADLHPRFSFMLTSVEPYGTYEEMITDTNRIITNIRYWRENFLEYFQSNGEVTNPGENLALTWEDIKKIDGLAMEVTTLFASVGRNKDILERPFYEEIARRFNEIRKK